jgi:glycosyltransferase involved in cell wall biosynthesis
VKLLLELRPALDGHAGIPQETRLLFRGLAQLQGAQVDGLLQSSNQLLARGLPADDAALRGWSTDRRVNRLSRVLVSLQPGDDASKAVRVRHMLRLGLSSAAMVAGSLLGRRQPLTRFEPEHFKDFVWRALFARTLAPEDHAAVTRARYRVARVPWSAAHASALLTRRLGAAVYPRLDTNGYDVMVAETPYPGRVSGSTRLVVRYHDAIPLLMPHTISDRAHHQASHYHALRRNVRDGAWFACVSEASRRDLISVFPEVEPRAVTIPNMVSHRYFAEDSAPARIPDIMRTRTNHQIDAQAVSLRRAEALPDVPAEPPERLDYLLMVSTLEPRKNHLTLLAAWERLRATGYPNLQLVLVGMLGWESKVIVRKLLPWIAQGQLHVLDEVPAAELRLLYRHARATVCPSFGEGFGFSGIEAMHCGGVVAASELPVHREIYADAAEYFNPYSADDLAHALERLISAEAQPRREELATQGAAIATRYLPEHVLPQWQTFLDTLAHRA